MDPQMVWDMMEECETPGESPATQHHCCEPERDRTVESEAPKKSSRAGWTPFPVWGMGR